MAERLRKRHQDEVRTKIQTSQLVNVLQNHALGIALRRAVVQSDAERLRMIAEALIDKAASGDVSAIKELGDRIDGKSVATTELTGVDGSNLPISIGINFVKPDDSSVS